MGKIQNGENMARFDGPSGGFLSHGGTPKMDLFMRENPIYKWMMSRGTPIPGNHQMIDWVPSGKRCFSISTSTISMAMFNSYVSLPEAIEFGDIPNLDRAQQRWDQGLHDKSSILEPHSHYYP